MSQVGLPDVGVRLEHKSNGQLVCPDDSLRRESVTAEESSILSVLARGRHVVEIGTGLGVSTHALAATARSVYTVDPDPWVAANIVLPENVTLYSSLADVPDIPWPELVFVDGAHDKASVLVDAEWAHRRATRETLVLFHDWSQTGVREAIDSLAWSARYRFLYLEACWV